MINKDKIVRADIVDANGNLIVTTKQLEFQKDFFAIGGKEFVVFKGTDIKEIAIGEPVKVIIYYRNGSRFQYETKIDLATDLQVNVHLGQQYAVLEERRRYYKTETNISGTVSNIIRGEDKALMGDHKDFPVRLHNINLGGIFMSSPEFEFLNGDCFDLSILDNEVVVPAEILRTQCDENGKVIGYGCKFIRLTPAQEERIGRHIFDCQLLSREKNRGY